MYWLKACQKCHGDLYRDKEVYGTYIACLQCGSSPTEAERAWFGLNTSGVSALPVSQAHLELMAA